MGDDKQALFARNLISICIDGTENADYQGKIWHQYSDDPLDFISFLDMLEIIDELLDEWDFPQKGLIERSFDKKEKPSYKRNSDSEELVIDKIQREKGTRNVQGKKGKKATFLLQVSFRQNATWQGHVICDKSGEKIDFESALELLRIMDKNIEM